jgi:hypothetical protein
MQFIRTSRRALAVLVALFAVGAYSAVAQAASSNGREARSDESAAGQSTTTAQHGGDIDHLPARAENIELVSKLELTGRFGDVVEGQIADVAYYKGFAYLNSWNEESCTRGGTYIVDMRDPRNPKEIGFVAAPPRSIHGEGAHVVTYKGRDILAVNNEPCQFAESGTGGPGGFDLIDVTDPYNPVKFGSLDAPTGGDTGPDDGSLIGDEVPHSNHSTFMWENGGKLYLTTVDNLELYDVDIFDISDPAAPQPVAEYDLVDRFAQIEDTGPIGSFAAEFHHDSVVKHIGDRVIALTGYWDAGYVTYDLTDPFNPTYISDSSYLGADPLTGLTPPEGNAHYAEFSHDNKYILAADEDFTTHRGGTFRITTGPDAGEFPSTGVGGGAPPATLPDRTMNGPTVYGGYGCDASAPIPQRSDYNFSLEPGEEAILVLQRGPAFDSDEDYDDDQDIANDPDDACFPGDKAANAWDAGWRNILLINRHQQSGDPADDSPACGSGGYDPEKVPVTVCTTHEAGHLIFGDEPEFGVPYDDDQEMAAIGQEGEKVEATSQFDGWGYAHLFRNNPGKMEEIDAWAVDESLDERYSSGFGDLSIHEHAADPTENLSYVAYYGAGARVISFGDSGIDEVGAFIDEGGNNFWGVEQFTAPNGQRMMALSDRDYGLYVLRYTGGPGAPPPPMPPSCESRTAASPDGKPVTIPLNCTDPNGNTLTLSIAGQPANGSLSAISGNQVTYTPKAGFNGQDAFTYRAFDGAAFSPAATITVIVGRCSNRLDATPGDDNIAGTVLGDAVSLQAGKDVASMAQGNDCAAGEAGDDQISAGAGADQVSGGDGNDRLFGDSENDSIRGDAGTDHLRGGSGNDRLRGDAGRDFLDGGSNNDRLVGGSGNDSLVGGSGNDRILGQSGNDTIDAGKGANRVAGGTGNDRIEAVNLRKDRISCGKGRDRVRADRKDVVSRDCELVKRTKTTRK